MGVGFCYLDSYSGKKYSRLVVNSALETTKVIKFLGCRGPYPWLRRVQVNDAIQILRILYEYNGSLVGKLRATSRYGNSSLGKSSNPYTV